MVWWPRADSASTSAIGLSIAAGLFALAFTTANLMVSKPGGAQIHDATLDVGAWTTLDVIIGQPGRIAGGGEWTDTPDALVRFGLANAGETNFLDYKKIKSLRNASMDAQPNNAPDYQDVRHALDLSTDFHLRTYPVLPDHDDPRWTKEAHGRFAYVAHDLGTSTPTGTATVTTYANTSGNALNASVAIRNDGATAYLFGATIGIGTVSTNGIIAEEERHTRLLAPGEVQTLWVEFPRMAYSGSPNGIRVTIADAAGRVIDGPTWTSATTASSGITHPASLKLSAGARYYVTGESVKFHLDRYTGTGTTPDFANTTRFVLVGPNGNEWDNTTITIAKKRSATYTCANCTALGVYAGYLYNDATPSSATLRAHDIVQLLAAAPSSGPPTFGGVAGNEIAAISSLVANFNPTVYDASTNPSGDVFDDANKVRGMPPILSRYSTLIVGSGVEQNALNSGDIKWAIADWVIDGGNLIVLGRADGHANWLQPVYLASITGAGGGIGAPDPTHPILTTPNRLEYQRYNDFGLAWGIRSDQPFTHVLTKGEAGGERQDALALANPGAFNSGSVVLTSYMPGALTTPQDNAEAARFLHNMMSQSYNMLFLDYGPPIPDAVPVGSAQRLVAIPHPNVPGAVVEVRIVMYAWD